MVVVETKHADVYLEGGVVVQKNRQTGRDTDIELKIALVRACKVFAGAVAELRLTAARLSLYLVEQTEARASSETQIITEDSCAYVAVADAVEVVDVV